MNLQSHNWRLGLLKFFQPLPIYGGRENTAVAGPPIPIWTRKPIMHFIKHTTAAEATAPAEQNSRRCLIRPA